MKLPDIKHLSTKAKAGVASGVVVLFGATTMALQEINTSTATEVSPIQTQVDDHEVRINGLEGRQATTEQKVEQNTNDIQVIQQTTGTSPSTTTSGGSTSSPTQTTTSPTTSEPAPTPDPTPEPPKHPRTITAVSDVDTGNGFHTCDYTLYDKAQDAKAGVYVQPNSQPCLAVGDVLPY